MRPTWRTHAILLAALLALNAAVKFTLWIQPPQTFTDSLGYVAPAMRLLDGLGYGSQENDFRTPTYPLFIAAIVFPFNHSDLSSCREARVPACLGEAQKEPSAQVNLRAVTAVQIVLGMLTILLVYAFAWQTAHNVWVAALCAATYPIDLSTGYWEISILSDLMTTFLLMVAVCLTVQAARGGRHSFRWLIALGGVLGALALCHFVFVFYAVVPFAFLFLRVKPRWQLAPLLVIPGLLVLGWAARNFVVDNYFSVSTITGINLTQMVGPFMEQAPERYRDLADIYLDYRAQRMAERGTHGGTIYVAYRDMMAERGITWSDLSKQLAAMSVEMMLRNPLGYLQTAWQSWNQFWKIGLGRQNPQLPISFDWVKWFLDTRVHQAAEFLFLLTPVALALVRWNRPTAHSNAQWIWFAIVTVLYAAIISAALSFGDTERYRTHVARLQYSAIILTAWYTWQAFRNRVRVPAMSTQ